MECKAYSYAIRGAVTLEKDDRDEMIQAVKEMYEAILNENRIDESELTFIHFSQTRDLVSMNAASALRASGYGKEVPLFCTQEAYTTGSLEHCVRVLIMVNHEERTPRKMVYLKGAEKLRPDLKR